MHITYIPVSATGHVLASLPLVTELCRCGARVSYFATPNYREMVEATGAEFYPIVTRITKPGKDDSSAPEDIEAGIPLMFLSEGAAIAPQIIEYLQRDLPDAIVTDTLAIAGRLVASALRIPFVQMYTSYASNDVFDISANLTPVPDSHPARIAARELAEELTKKYGVEHLGLRQIFGGSPCPLNLVTIQKEFQPASETFDDSFLFIGAQITHRTGASWTPPADHRPLIYSSLGTVFNTWPEFYIMLGEAVKELPVNVIASIGTVIQREDLGELPPNMQVQPFLPQLEVLEKTDLFLTHAGIGSVMEAIYYGVPMLAFPQMGEQIVTALRMQELGLGKAIIGREQVNADLFRELIQQMLKDSTLSRHLAAARDKMLTGDNATTAALRVIDYATRR